MKLFANLNLSTRIIAISTLSLIAVVGINYAIFVSDYHGAAEEALMEKAAAFTAVADAAKEHQASIVNSGALDMKGLLEELEETLAKGGDYKTARIFPTIPVVAGWSAAEAAASKEHIQFQIASFNSRNPENTPASGSFRAVMLKDLERQRESGGDESLGRVNPETNSLHYMRSIQLDGSCMMCHGVPGNEWDTDGDGKDPLGFAMESWKPSDYHGAFEVVMPLGPMDAQVASFIGMGLLWTVPLVAAVGIFFVFFIRKSFSAPLKHMSDVIGDIAAGDLRQRLVVTRQDELGTVSSWFNEFIEKLDGSIGQIGSASVQIDTGATQVSATAQSLSSGATQQAASLEEISASLEETNSMTSQNTENSLQANDLSTQAKDAADSGRTEVADMSTAMDDIKESSDSVGKIIKVIDEIAFQTNLLALNAAVEAARAGEAGKGFAVVAEEVRSLAQRSADAARETATLLQESTTRADRAVEISARVSERLTIIADHTNKVNALLGDIGEASKEQSTGINQINTGVSELDGVIQQNAANSEELAAASEETAAQVTMLRDLVDQFQTSDQMAA